MLQRIDHALLDDLSRRAQASPRRRLNHNLHPTYDDPCQRLLNAVEPDSYIRPHRHTLPPKSETFLVLRGRFCLVLFDDAGGIRELLELSASGPLPGAEVAPGDWHMILAREPGSVFFETKQGPYQPLHDKDFAPWAPPEGSPGAAEWLAALQDRLAARGSR